MQDDQFSAAEKILLDIEMVFKKDPKLTDFSIIPVKINQNKSPVIHLNHCLGLESWCIRHVYSYVYRHIMDSRQLRHRREDPSVIGRWLFGALLINPDVSSFWNMRRQASLADRLDVDREYLLTATILSRKPKSAETFAHRKWLTTRLVSRGGTNITSILACEFEVCENAANRQPNNYHAWTHRAWCLTELGSRATHPLQVCLEQWAWSANWIQTHISDHSGLHYRQVLQKYLYKLMVEPSSHNLLVSIPLGSELIDSSILGLNQYVSVEEMIDPDRKHELEIMDRYNVSTRAVMLGITVGELLANDDLITRYSGHEALWYHRRFLLAMLKDLFAEGTDVERSRCETGSYPCKPVGKSACHRNKEGVPVEKDQKLSEQEESGDRRLSRWLCEVVPWHEFLLFEQFRAKDDYQRQLAQRHQNWLGTMLRLGPLHYNTTPVEN